jgi:hypothetical protein
LCFEGKTTTTTITIATTTTITKQNNGERTIVWGKK